MGHSQSEPNACGETRAVRPNGTAVPCPTCGGCGGRFDATFIEDGCRTCEGRGAVLLTVPQVAALRVLADGADHWMWKRGTNPDVAGGRVNTTACLALTKRRLARYTDYGTPTSAGRVRITTDGAAVVEALDG